MQLFVDEIFLVKRKSDNDPQSIRNIFNDWDEAKDWLEFYIENTSWATSEMFEIITLKEYFGRVMEFL